MALTLVRLESLIVGRVGNLMAVVGITQENGGLFAPIAWAVRQVGGTTADSYKATTEEVEAVDASLHDDLFDLAEYRVLLNIQGNLDLVDITAGPRKESLSQLQDVVAARIAKAEDALASYMSPMTMGYLTLDFLEHNE